MLVVLNGYRPPLVRLDDRSAADGYRFSLATQDHSLVL